MTAYLTNNLNVVVEDVFYDDETASEIFEELKKLEFKTPSFRFNGNVVYPKRKHCGFGDAGISYNFSGISVPAQPWTPLMLKLKTDVETICQCKFNFALVNFYQDGASKISHHRDDEKCLLPNQPIPTLSFGAVRTLQFRRKEYPDVNIPVKHGSLYIMNPPTNQLFTHAILEDEHCMESRISVTFRNITSSRKRKNCEDELPNDDWLYRYYKDMKTMQSTNFSLSENIFVTVKEFADKFYVDIRRYQKSKKGPHMPTKEGVMMSASEYFFFQEKICNFNFLYPDASTIAGNILLLNVNNKLHMQQLMTSPNSGFTLKNNFIELFPFEVERLVNYLPDINNCVRNSLWCEFFPLSFAKKCGENQVASEISEMKHAFIELLELHFIEVFKKTFKCAGCLVDSNSQLNHDCLYTSNRRKLEHCGENIFMLVNIEQLISELLEKKIFSSDFFSKEIDYDNLKNELFSNEEENLM